MRNNLILAAGLILSTCLPVEAQIPVKQIVLMQASAGRTLILFRAPQDRFPPPAFVLAAAYKPEPSFESRLPIQEVRTPFLTESSFLVAYLWRGLQLDVVDSTLHFHNLELGPPRFGSSFQGLRSPIHDQTGVASSVELDGIGLRYSFGRDAEARKPKQIWRCVLWVVGNGRRCSL